MANFIVFILFGTLAAIFDYSAWYSFSNKTKLTIYGNSVDGTVLTLRGCHVSGSGRYSTTPTNPNFCPTVEFEANGRKIQFESSFDRPESQWNIGQSVKVLYFPQSPETAEINDPWLLWKTTLLFGTLGFLLTGVLLAWVSFSLFSKRKDEERISP